MQVNSTVPVTSLEQLPQVAPQLERESNVRVLESRQNEPPTVNLAWSLVGEPELSISRGTYLLTQLLNPAGGRKRKSTEAGDEIRSKHREGGSAPRAAAFVESVLQQTSKNRGYIKPLTVRDLLPYSPEGQSIASELQLANNTKQLGVNALTLAKKRGKAFTDIVLGTLSEGIKPIAAAREMFAVSETTIRDSRKAAKESEMNPSLRGPFETLQQKPGGTKNTVSALEVVSSSLLHKTSSNHYY